MGTVYLSVTCFCFSFGSVGFELEGFSSFSFNREAIKSGLRRWSEEKVANQVLLIISQEVCFLFLMEKKKIYIEPLMECRNCYVLPEYG